LKAGFQEVKRAARGGWYGILTSTGISDSYLRNRHQPRFDDKEGNGTFYCGGGGEPVSGDGFKLIQHFTGCTPAESLQQVAHILGMDSGDYQPPPVNISTPERPPEPTRAPTYNEAKAIWGRVQSCRDDALIASHPYAIRKGITWAAGAARGRVSGSLIGKDADCIVVPMHTLEGEFCGVECINGEGKKQTFGNKGVLLLGDKKNKSLPIHLVEGWADGVSAKEMFGDVLAVVVFGKDALEKKAAEIQSYNPARSITIWPDNDKTKEEIAA
jgi:putative DNA primase/helicase